MYVNHFDNLPTEVKLNMSELDTKASRKMSELSKMNKEQVQPTKNKQISENLINHELQRKNGSLVFPDAENQEEYQMILKLQSTNPGLEQTYKNLRSKKIRKTSTNSKKS